MNLKTVTGAAVELSETTFGREFNEALVHQVVTAYLAGARQGTRAQKTRGEVSGGGKKPWRQKRYWSCPCGFYPWTNLGRRWSCICRQTTRLVSKSKPQNVSWCHAVHPSRACTPRAFGLVDSISVDSPKTKGLVAKLAELNAPRALIVTHEVDENLYLAARNIPYVNVLGTREVDPVSLVSFDKVIMTVEAAKQFEETLA